MIKILSIGQLPKEVGGSYTSGIARVVYELSKQKCFGVKTYLYATNISENKAYGLTYPNQYIGYVIKPLEMFFEMLRHPSRTIRQCFFYKYKSYENPIRFEFLRYNIKRAIDIVQPDIIHMHSGGIDALYFANETKIPVLLTLHGMMWDGDEQDFKTKNRYLNNLPLVDYYTGLNKEVKRKMARFDLPEDKITLIPNGIDSSKFYFSPEKRLEFRKKYDVEDDCIVFITVGLVIDRKGQFDTLKILESLGIKYQYWIMGKGPDYDPIQQYVSEKHLETKVRLFGYISDKDLYQYHSAADVYAHASTMEGQSLAEIEAFSTGLRVLVRKEIAGTVIGDAYQDYLNYFILDYDNVIADRLKKWLMQGNVNRCSKLKYDWSVIQKQYVELYHEILNNKITEPTLTRGSIK